MIYPAEHFGCWFYLAPSFIGLDNREKEENVVVRFLYSGEERERDEGGRAQITFSGPEMDVWVREDDAV